MAKGTPQAEVTSNSEKIKPIALAIACLKASGSQFRSNYLKAFQVNLKA